MLPKEPVVYFHGLPGGPREIEAFGGVGRWLTAQDFVPDRQTIAKGASLSQHFELLASAIADRFEHSPVRFVGFSLGAYVALEVSRRMGPAVSQISLVSAGAPLSDSNFLPDMAGQIVFRAARHAPLSFAALTSLQSLLARLAPNKLFDALFAGAQGLDRQLATQPIFRAAIIAAITECLSKGASGYRHELRGYVQNWSPILSSITQPVELWHGSVDNWAPPSMAEALANSLPNVTSLHRLEGFSHYSTLRAFIERQNDGLRA